MDTNLTGLLTTEETCKALGNIGRTTLHRESRDKESALRSVRVGKRRMFLADSVEAEIRRHVEGPQDLKPAPSGAL